ncbi:hypothetical protein [Frigidibacter sp.]|uniref:hypothetical protein n=1 Tax=Frigidibacter sp. TaxID=2586418 RepID=UPI002733089E|nr:hypothetical protein [Frigidibacter sp.]MDP3339685.1 hypothetical protein [Frigidibacter sp.]
MRHSLHRSLPLLALAGIGWLFWSAGRRDPRSPVGLLARPQNAEAEPVSSGKRAKSVSAPTSGKAGHQRAANSPAAINGFQPVRAAGPSAMKDPPQDWDEVDEENDESFPASDPPGRY